MCPNLTAPVNGMVSFTGNKIGDTATYSCNSGFELVGTRNITCQSNAQWSAPSPVCNLAGMYIYLCIYIHKNLFLKSSRCMEIVPKTVETSVLYGGIYGMRNKVNC